MVVSGNANVHKKLLIFFLYWNNRIEIHFPLQKNRKIRISHMKNKFKLEFEFSILMLIIIFIKDVTIECDKNSN